LLILLVREVTYSHLLQATATSFKQSIANCFTFKYDWNNRKL